jgi:glutamate/tyrosine decarboxylase-like PLP-dependent enzyme
MAHVTALLAARHQLLAARGWDVEERGLSGAPAIRVLTSTEAHGTIERALRMIGVGKGAIVPLPVGADGRLKPAALGEALAASKAAPTIVVLLAGDLNLGAFDDFRTLIPLAHQHRAWVHLDGAFGLWAAASPSRRAMLDGAAAADSWATDAHKWLNVPYDSGLAFVASPRDHRDAMSHRASYMTDGGDAREQVDWNPEWSRRARGFPIYAAIRELGRTGVAALVDRCCDHALALVDGLGKLDGVEVLRRPTLNQGLVRFVDRKAGATEADHAARTEEVIARLLRDGTAYFGPVTWQGRRAMRISVCNWRTSAKDVERTVAAVARCLV